MEFDKLRERREAERAGASENIELWWGMDLECESELVRELDQMEDCDGKRERNDNQINREATLALMRVL